MGPDRQRSPAATAAPWTATEKVALFALIVGSSASLIWLVHPYHDLPFDASVYILTAQAILSGEGYSYLGEPFTLRPPGFPLLLTPVLALFGSQPLALNLWASLFGVSCVALLFVYFRPRLGVPLSVAVALAVWLNPSFQRWSTQAMSDVPGAALMLGCLVLDRWARRDPFPRRDLVLGLALAAATYVRSINVFLLPAILVARWLRRGEPDGGTEPLARFVRLRASILIAVTLVALAPWSVRNAILAPDGPAEQTRNYSYRTAMFHTDPGDPGSPLVAPGEILARVPVRLGEILPLLGSRMKTREAGPVSVGLGMIGLVAWCFVLVRRRGAGEIFAGAALVVLSVYFVMLTRLVLPVYLLVLGAVAEAALRAGNRLVPGRVAALGVTLLVTLLAVYDFDPRAGWKEIERRHALHTSVGRYLASAYPEETALAAVEAAPLSVHAGRPVYGLKPALRRSGVAGAVEVLRRHGVGAVAVPGSQVRLLAHLTERHPVDERLGPVWIIRLEGPQELAAPTTPAPRAR
jgi:hypothetical protein